MKDIITIQSISQLHELVGYAKPKHPLITVLDYSRFKPNPEHASIRFVTNFYLISLKSPAPKSLIYGRNYYDFAEGTLIYVAPNQVVSLGEIDDSTAYDGWGVYFHADLINGTLLGKKIKDYSFFGYQVNEALHVSEDEKLVLKQIVQNIEREYQGNLDRFSHTLVVNYLEQLLNYSDRFYHRQFITRQKPNSELLSRFEALLKDYFNRPSIETGLPTVEFFADQLALSAGYLTDLLKHETGKTTKEHIQSELIEQAKIRLLNSSKTINEIAYDLGFDYPQYFNRLFKSKTGQTPLQFRHLN
jgi:AraC-like DNA-binding protein